MRVLITGGYGCIGSWITRDLLAAGHSVYVYDLKQDTHRMEWVLDEDALAEVRFVQGDVTDLGQLRSALEEHEVSHVVHLAGLQVPVCRADPLLGAKVNVLGTLAVFEAVRELGPQIQRLVYASSAAVFGPPEDYPITPVPDDVQLTPQTHYGHFKCCNEGNARVYYLDHGLSSIGLRPCTVYGVGRDFGMTSEPTKAIQATAIGESYSISYGGFQDYQYAEDIGKTFIACLEAPFEGAKAYNLRGDVVDMSTICETLARIEPTATDLITHGDLQLPIAYDLADDALQADVGPLAKTSLEDGIRQTLAHFRRLYRDGVLDPGDFGV